MFEKSKSRWIKVNLTKFDMMNSPNEETIQNVCLLSYVKNVSIWLPENSVIRKFKVLTSKKMRCQHFMEPWNLFLLINISKFFLELLQASKLQVIK